LEDTDTKAAKEIGNRGTTLIKCSRRKTCTRCVLQCPQETERPVRGLGCADTGDGLCAWGFANLAIDRLSEYLELFGLNML